MTATCIMCGGEEVYHHGGRRVVYQPGARVVSIVCSGCTYRLVDASQEALTRAHVLAIEHGCLEKVALLSTLIEEEEINVTETREPRRDMVRKRPGRAARPANY